MKEIKLKINGMMCEGCENRVKSAVSLIEGVEKVEADHNTGIVIVTSKEDIDISKIKEKIIDIGYEIEEFKIMGETFTVDEKNGPTTQEIQNKINTEYPFKIKIEKDDTQLSEGKGNGKFVISLDWDFEAETENGDEIDTEWGNKAYEFYSLHPGENSIEIKMTLMATQKAE